MSTSNSINGAGEVTPMTIVKSLRRAFNINEDRELLGVEVEVRVVKNIEEFEKAGPKDKVSTKQIISMPIGFDMPAKEMTELLSHQMRCMMAIDKSIESRPTIAKIKFIFEGAEKGGGTYQVGTDLKEYLNTAAKVAALSVLGRLMDSLPDNDEEE